jgi:hypothetical protein
MRNIKINPEPLRISLVNALNSRYGSVTKAAIELGYKYPKGLFALIYKLNKKDVSSEILLKLTGLLAYLNESKKPEPKEVNYNAVYSVSVIHYNEGLHQTVKYIASEKVKIKEITQTRVRPYHLLIEINRVTIAVFNPVQVAYK